MLISGLFSFHEHLHNRNYKKVHILPEAKTSPSFVLASS